MSRKVQTKESNLPTHELVVKFTLPNGKETTIGRIGLFTENNDVHELIQALDNEGIKTLLSKCYGEVIEYGSSSKEKITSLF